MVNSGAICRLNDTRGGGCCFRQELSFFVFIYETVNVENYKHFNDGRHIIYVNASFKDDESALGKLTHDLLCQRPDEMNYKALADKARYLKEDKEGIMKSKSVIEEIRVEAEKNKDIDYNSQYQ